MSAPSDKMWMTMEEARTPQDADYARDDEFAPGAAEWPEGLSRRNFLRLAGGTIALAGLTGCHLPDQKIVPYTDQPEKLIPGRPLHFATTIRVNGSPRGVVVTSNEGRPTHIAGNPKHPLSKGACDAWTTAALYDLYDPDRLQTPLHRAAPAAWSDFVAQMLAMSRDWANSGGEGICMLMPPPVSPTEARLVEELFAKYPQARAYTYDPVIDFGEPLPTFSFDLAQTDVIFALESNFLFDRPDSLALTRAFSMRRDSDAGRDWCRLYVAEICPTITGAKADHRFVVTPQELDDLAASLEALISGKTAETSRWPWLSDVVDDLRRAGPRAVLLAGRSLSLAALNAIRSAENNLGVKTQQINFTRPRWAASLPMLADRIRLHEAKALFILGGNPAFDTPADLKMTDLLREVPLTIHLAPSLNETGAVCTWVLNEAHDLESWGDARAVDDTGSIRQPLIAPLYDGRSAIELLALLATGTEQPGYELVRATWQSNESTAETFETAWHRWLRDGVIDRTALPMNAAAELPMPVVFDGAPEKPKAVAKSDQVWLGFRPSDALWDGRYANNGWLMELPDSLTKLTWDNALLISPMLAAERGFVEGDVVSVHCEDDVLEVPVLLVPGHADSCVTLPLGYGRTVCGALGKNVGVSAYHLRTRVYPWFRPIDKLERTGKRVVFARTQLHSRIEGRDLLHVGRVDEAAPHLTSQPAKQEEAPSLYPGFPYAGHRWAMTIDLNSCIGCNACIIACQSENNIPVVGREQVYMGREMQWIRVDRYYEGAEDAPRIHFQPVPCMQCENAPCEVVCPVAATQHDDEGLNVMVYNRCVGTRYCSNNCPYKVRRFNFLHYNASVPAVRQLGFNPNVTVRSRGVMEKCTYCQQRIEEARIAAKREDRPLRGSNIVTACQSACPAQAIVFGDLADPDSAVSRNRNKPGHYAMLGELNTRPRTTYLEKQLNPNPVLEPRSPEPATPTSI